MFYTSVPENSILRYKFPNPFQGTHCITQLRITTYFEEKKTLDVCIINNKTVKPPEINIGSNIIENSTSESRIYPEVGSKYPFLCHLQPISPSLSLVDV